MKSFMFYLFASLLLINSCQVNSTNNNKKRVVTNDSLLYKEVLINNNFADTCLVFIDDKGDTVSFNRNFEIMENSFGDTMNVGLNFVKPNDKGRYFTIQIDTSSSKTIFREKEYRRYLEEQDLPELYTKWLCIHNLSLWHWHKTTGTGQMRIRVYYKPTELNTSTKN